MLDYIKEFMNFLKIPCNFHNLLLKEPRPDDTLTIRKSLSWVKEKVVSIIIYISLNVLTLFFVEAHNVERNNKWTKNIESGIIININIFKASMFI